MTSFPLNPVPSPPLLHCILTKSSHLIAQFTLSCSLEKQHFQPFLPCTPFSATSEVRPCIHSLSTCSPRCFAFSDHPSISFIGFSSSTIVPHDLILIFSNYILFMAILSILSVPYFCLYTNGSQISPILTSFI